MRFSRVALALAVSLCLIATPACSSGGDTSTNTDTVEKEEDVVLTEDDVETDDDEGEAEEQSTDLDDLMEDEEDEGDTQDSQRVGQAGIGFVTIPDSWTEFQDVDGNTSLQWCDGTPYTVISLNTFDLSSVPEDQRADFTVEDAANSVYANILNDGVSEEDVEGARVQLAGRDALQVYAFYPDGGFLVTWTLADDEGVIHYVAAEGTEDTIMDSVSIVENTYSFTE